MFKALREEVAVAPIYNKRCWDLLNFACGISDLINEYYGASEAAFAAMEQVEYFSSHARMAKAKQDWPDEQDLWDAASRTMLSSIKHRD